MNKSGQLANTKIGIIWLICFKKWYYGLNGREKLMKKNFWTGIIIILRKKVNGENFYTIIIYIIMNMIQRIH